MMRQIFAKLMLVFGLACLALFTYSYVSSTLYESAESRRFDQQRIEAAVSPAPPEPKARARTLESGSTIGRLSVPRLAVKAMVAEGIGDATLDHAIGHIPGTALPGQSGNVAVAGHRDTFFRSLKNLRRNDQIVFTTLNGTYRYSVDEMEIVEPSNVSVLAASQANTLTIVTCYPFRYIGPAPKRFIVKARQLD